MIGKLNASVLSHSALKSESKPASSSGALKSENANETKQSRIERISSEIANGTYKLDMSKTARAVLDSLS
ncbi:flagellar biosynthesis anti-sigma factor FlgM [Campylobacter sp. 19-13652]|uniref:flagellar biosynthesis anti-sigma factor FlgM n=1 Tax=Campylobacter sp. 19-13652 TaxID=2840180 RepID=UPI001C762C52|nr:flagellar biosynthesis anti-sigma factor FlgM [Campylobacter sp. 19-13652]BCX79752.1 hypothetical protein LBC_12140 [Campylobacter sp. 19-13652]